MKKTKPLIPVEGLPFLHFPFSPSFL
jgi:hypothetical protein